MFKLCSSALAIVLLACPALAAAQILEGGIKGGVTFADVPKLAELIGSEGADTSSRIGIAAGGYIAFNFGGVFAIQPEILFNQRGLSGDAPNDAGRFTLEIDYLSAPVLVRVGFPGNGFKVLAGPSFNFNIRAAGTAEGEEDEDLSENFEDIDIGVVVGAGYYGNRLIIEGRYEQGLTNLAPIEFAGVSFRQRVFMILAGVRFP